MICISNKFLGDVAILIWGSHWFRRICLWFPSSTPGFQPYRSPCPPCSLPKGLFPGPHTHQVLSGLDMAHAVSTYLPLALRSSSLWHLSSFGKCLGKPSWASQRSVSPLWLISVGVLSSKPPLGSYSLRNIHPYRLRAPWWQGLWHSDHTGCLPSAPGVHGTSEHSANICWMNTFTAPPPKRTQEILWNWETWKSFVS